MCGGKEVVRRPGPVVVAGGAVALGPRFEGAPSSHIHVVYIRAKL